MTPPQLLSIQQVATNPRNIVVTSLDVTFSEPINLSTFTTADLSLTRNGGPNLIDSRVTISPVSGSTYEIAGFNWVVGQQGTYTLTVSGAGVQDLAGNVGSGTASASWVMDTTPPAAPTNLLVSPATLTSGTWNTGTTHVEVTGTLPENNLTVQFYDLTTLTSLGSATVTGTSFVAPLSLGVFGTHQIQMATIDPAGNETDTTLNVFVTQGAQRRGGRHYAGRARGRFRAGRPDDPHLQRAGQRLDAQ